jgi:hypothetical protein
MRRYHCYKGYTGRNVFQSHLVQTKHDAAGFVQRKLNSRRGDTALSPKQKKMEGKKMNIPYHENKA